MRDVRAWLLWAVTMLIVSSRTRNPLYIVLLLLALAIVDSVYTPRTQRGRTPSPFRFLRYTVPIAAAFNAVTVHYGEHVLFRLPEWIPLFGGTVTLEATLYGAINGLALTLIFAAFTILNRVTPVHDLVRLAPKALHESGVALSIALTFMPQTTRSLQRIREAQALRGHRVRGLRDWLPIVVPLLVSGMERSLCLAEAMVARGYGAVADRGQPLRTRLLLALGLMGLLGGWVGWTFWREARAVALAVGVLGVLILVATVWLAGRRVARTRYRARHWTRGDTLMVGGSLIALAVAVLPVPFLPVETLVYSPYPRLIWPEFSPWVAALLLGVLAPAMVAPPDEGGAT